MKSTARDVTTGSSNPVSGSPVFPAGYTATVGVDIATGTGLVDAHKAVMVAKVQCLGPVSPIVGPTPIVGPSPIVGPIGPPAPPAPVRPIQPVLPIQPIRPIQPGPVVPIQPIRPIAPIVNPGPVQPIPQEEAGGSGMEGSAEGGASQSALSSEDVTALSDLIINSEFESE